MAGWLRLNEIDLRKKDDPAWAVARLIVSELIDHNADTLEFSTRAYMERQPFAQHRHFVLTCNEVLAGAVSIRLDTTRAGTFAVDGLVVNETHRGNDYGRIMLGLIAQQASRDGAQSLSLGTWIPSYFEQYGFSGDRREMCASIDSVIALTGIDTEKFITPA